jgi:hypothetical protein
MKVVKTNNQKEKNKIKLAKNKDKKFSNFLADKAIQYRF